jgi:hypothetical protein
MKFQNPGLAIDAAGVGLFLMATAESFNVISALCSSPWTAENFGADEEKARSTREYVLMSGVFNVGLGAGTSLLAKSWWPLVGTTTVSVIMWFVYQRALEKGKTAGSSGWSK